MITGKLIQRFAQLAGVLVVLAIAVLSLMPGEELSEVNMSDKLGHLVAYAVLAGLAVIARRRASLLRILAMVIGYGVVLEAAQGLMPFGRTASWLDAAANTAGAVLGAGGGAIASMLLRRIG